MMDDLISRAAAIKKFAEKREVWYGNGPLPSNESLMWQAAISITEELPSVDAAPIIRCASCKWWNGSTLGAAHRCAALHISTTGEFFCAAAERKTNAFADQSGTEYADNPTV